ncbi:MAG: TonB family protein [Proteobacteria bacterium]|nr:TonB family protein [Pseudomonadota bacterium]
MSHESSEAPKTSTPASKGNGMKWLGGAALAAVLLGGGYYAWSQYGPQSSTASTQQSLAQNTSDAATYAGPLPAQQQSTGNSVASPTDDVSGSHATGIAQSTTATPAHRRTAPRVAATQASEEVIGVAPASATASAQDSEPIIVEGQRRPVWTHTPSHWRLAETYPARALEEGREGEASLHCTVLNNGALDCAPVSEYPARAGFGGAAMRVAHMYRHAPTLRDGKDAIGSPVNLRVVFRVDDNTRRG